MNESISSDVLDGWLPTNQVADFYKISKKTLERWAEMGIGPKRHEFSPGIVRYWGPDVRAYRPGQAA